MSQSPPNISGHNVPAELGQWLIWEEEIKVI